MPELIDRQSALSVCKEYCWLDDEAFIEGYNTAIKDMREAINELPTVEAELVKHGKWTDDTTDVVCSNCKARYEYEMLILIARGIRSKHVDGMTCRH